MAILALVVIAIGLGACSSSTAPPTTTTTTTTTTTLATTTTTLPSAAQSTAAVKSAYSVLFDLADPALSPKLAVIQRRSGPRLCHDDGAQEPTGRSRRGCM